LSTGVVNQALRWDAVGLLQRGLRRLKLLPPLQTGREGERLAALLLRRGGYRILGRNLRNRFGEIDLVALAPDRRTLVIVEVKSREGADGALPPELHVTPAKQRKLAALALQLVRQFHLGDRPVRFDVIGVDLRPGDTPLMRHHVAAFESVY
jgi:putative endonuclease